MKKQKAHAILSTDDKIEFHPLPIPLRDRFAMEAMNAIIQIGAMEENKKGHGHGLDMTYYWESGIYFDNIARTAYNIADAMMEARKEDEDETT